MQKCHPTFVYTMPLVINKVKAKDKHLTIFSEQTKQVGPRSFVFSFSLNSLLATSGQPVHITPVIRVYPCTL